MTLITQIQNETISKKAIPHLDEEWSLFTESLYYCYYRWSQYQNKQHRENKNCGGKNNLNWQLSR